MRLVEARETDQRTAELDSQRGELIASVIGMTFAASGLPDGAVGVLRQVCTRVLRNSSTGDVLAVDPATAEQAQREIRQWIRDDVAANVRAEVIAELEAAEEARKATEQLLLEAGYEEEPEAEVVELKPTPRPPAPDGFAWVPKPRRSVPFVDPASVGSGSSEFS